MKTGILFFCFSVFLFACKQENVSAPIPMGYEYFPVNIGHTIIYDFDSVFKDTKVDVNETTHFQIKEYIESVFSDNTNRPTQRIERYRRNNDTTVWTIMNVCTSTLTNTVAERVEDNQRYIKLVFPVSLNKTWFGNSFTTQPKWEYEYTKVNESATINGIKFDSTLTVTQIDELNLIEKNYSIEKYAKHVGLIYKEYIHLETLPSGDITKANVSTCKFKSYTP